MGGNHIPPVLLLASLLATARSLSQALALSLSGEQQLANGPKDCFPGLVYDQRYNACQCVNATLFGSAVMCQTNQAKVEQPSFCITSDWKNPNLVVGGVCPYLSPSKVAIQEWKLPKEDVNSISCKPLNRNQTLCGKCAENYSLAINSYNFRCLSSRKCKTQNILVILLSIFGPLTVFYCVIFLLQVNMAVSYRFAFVLYAQTLSLYIL